MDSGALTDPRKKLVQQGYDAIAERHLTWSGQIAGDPRDRFLEELAARLPDGAQVLDLGCGAGVPSTALLTGRFEVVGVDISGGQLRLARKHVPTATFVHADLCRLTLPAESFDAVTAFYSLGHVPREEQAELFRRIARWLRPGGLFLASLGAGGNPDSIQASWLGVPMFFSSHDAATNRALLAGAGFELLVDEVVEIREPDEGTVAFLWLVARRTDAGHVSRV